MAGQDAPERAALGQFCHTLSQYQTTRSTIRCLSTKQSIASYRTSRTAAVARSVGSSATLCQYQHRVPQP
eukprot:3812840-Rhodomonas_salina.2